MSYPAPTTARFLYVLLALFAVLRIDLWLWTEPSRVFGLPAGLAFHTAYCLVAATCLGVLVRHAWPSHLALEEGDESETEGRE